MLETKDFQFEVKAADEGRFTGKASVYGVVDLGGDVVMPGAFAKSLAAKSLVPVLNHHDQRDGVGMAKLVDSPEALLVEDGSLLLDVQSGRECYSRLKAGVITGISIGYITKQDAYQGSVRQLLEVEVHEVSLVTFPMNPLARVNAVKSAFSFVGRGFPEAKALERLLFTPDLMVALDEARAIAALEGEAKAGRTLSASNMQLLSDAIAALKAAHDALKAIDAAAKPKDEEDKSHEVAGQAVKALLAEMRGALAASA